jgi:hypothetical protein
MMNTVSYPNFGMLGPLEILVILAVLGSLLLLAGLVVVVIALVVNCRSNRDQSKQPPPLKS